LGGGKSAALLAEEDRPLFEEGGEDDDDDDDDDDALMYNKRLLCCSCCSPDGFRFDMTNGEMRSTPFVDSICRGVANVGVECRTEKALALIVSEAKIDSTCAHPRAFIFLLSTLVLLLFELTVKIILAAYHNSTLTPVKPLTTRSERASLSYTNPLGHSSLFEFVASPAYFLLVTRSCGMT